MFQTTNQIGHQSSSIPRHDELCCQPKTTLTKGLYKYRGLWSLWCGDQKTASEGLKALVGGYVSGGGV